MKNTSHLLFPHTPPPPLFPLLPVSPPLPPPDKKNPPPPCINPCKVLRHSIADSNTQIFGQFPAERKEKGLVIRRYSFPRDIQLFCFFLIPTKYIGENYAILLQAYKLLILYKSGSLFCQLSHLVIESDPIKMVYTRAISARIAWEESQ